jgi:hypothetical protein
LQQGVGAGPVAAYATSDESFERGQLVCGAAGQQDRSNVGFAREFRQRVGCQTVGAPLKGIGPVLQEVLDHRRVPSTRRHVQGRLSVGAPREVGIRAVFEQPPRSVRVRGPLHHVDEGRHACRNAVQVGAESVQQLKRRNVAAATGNVHRDAVGGDGACFKQDLCQRKVPHCADGRPQCRSRQFRMPVPVVFRIRVGAKRAQAARDRDEVIHLRNGVAMEARVAHVEQRFPLLRSGGLGGQCGLFGEAPLDAGHVTQYQCGVQRGRLDAGVPVEKTERSPGGAARGAPDELIDGVAERHRSRLNLIAQGVPRRKAVFTGDDRLRVVKREGRAVLQRPTREGRERGEPLKCRQVTLTRGVKQRLGEFLQMIEIRTIGQLRGHTASMLGPVVRKRVARRCMCRWSNSLKVGLALRANPPAP